MFHKTFKTVVMAVAVLFVVAPFALADKAPTSLSGKTPQSQKQYGTTQTGTMGMQDEKAISATVTEVDQQDKRLSLRLEDGETVDLQVSETLLSTLQEGDSVEVSIRKADKMHTPGMGGTQPSQQRSR